MEVKEEEEKEEEEEEEEKKKKKKRKRKEEEESRELRAKEGQENTCQTENRNLGSEEKKEQRN